MDMDNVDLNGCDAARVAELEERLRKMGERVAELESSVGYYKTVNAQLEEKIRCVNIITKM